MSKWRCYNLFEKVEGFAVNLVLVVTEYYASGGKLLLKVEEHVCLTFHFTPPANFLSSLLALQTNAIKFNVVFLVCLGVGLWVFRINMLSALWRWRATTPNICILSTLPNFFVDVFYVVVLNHCHCMFDYLNIIFCGWTDTCGRL